VITGKQVERDSHRYQKTPLLKEGNAAQGQVAQREHLGGVQGSAKQGQGWLDQALVIVPPQAGAWS